VLNVVFALVVVFSVLWAAYFGGMQAVTLAVTETATTAVELALKLVGLMAFFLGLMRVAQDGGLLRIIARVVGPVLQYIFPGVPRDHPAMSAMLMNIASNLLGLGNAATPFGIKAIAELDKLNGEKGTATNAMVVFLAINTSGLAILPTGVISMRTAAGSLDPAGIFFTTWFASGCATMVGILAAHGLARLPVFRKSEPPAVAPGPDDEVSEDEPASQGVSGHVAPWKSIVAVSVGLGFVVALILNVVRLAGSIPALDVFKDVASYWVIPALILSIVMFGWARGVQVYESLVEGAKEGFQVAIRIIPYLVAILVMVGMFRASGGMAMVVGALDPFTGPLGFPAEALPVAILRPFSGSGAWAVMVEIMEANGPDSFIGYMVSTLSGSTDTTFYVLAVYFGAIGVKRTRHAVPACLLADLAGVSAAVFIVNLLYG
jgi:spore maturation protein SpmA